ncbi:MAG: hypothetical protein M1160_00730 [Candidatus Marsarchaeota archaeon]|jgi:hypothetical protein|nr:hypothetical protein [Candidatus Marsarchaeota archaeon]MCL5111392.1 hypothetical protein [Candidatus Marsarchaeota archaeon]
MVEKADLLIFKMREGSATQPAEAQPATTQPAETQQVTPPPAKAASQKKKKEKGQDLKEQSRQAAKGLYCEWHPWRPAYAVCYTCHKPFCYEDISEYNGKYYCLEDIDAAVATEKPQLTFVFNKVSMLPASLFLLTMLVYIYFVNALFAYIATNAAKVGIQVFIASNFIQRVNLSYVMLFVGLIILAFLFVGGLLIFAQSRKGYWLSIFSGSIAFIFFSYVYIANLQDYGFIIGALTLVGLISMRFAVSSTATEEEQEAAAPPLPSSFTYGVQSPMRF